MPPAVVAATAAPAAAAAAAAAASSTPQRAQVHASVVLSIVDHHMRKPQGSHRVIGTLLGVSHGNGVVEITSSYAVPHVEKDSEVAIGKEFNSKMKQLFAKSHPGEQVVGWYSTSQNPSVLVDAKSCLMHDYYVSSSAGAEPVHLVVDVKSGGALSCFYSVALAASPTSRALGAEFRPIAVEPVANGPERIALRALQAPTAQQSQSVDKLLELLAQACECAAQQGNGNSEVGQRLTDLLARVDLSQPASQALAKSLQDCEQDLTLVVQLAKLTQSQLVVAERLSAVI